MSNPPCDQKNLLNSPPDPGSRYRHRRTGNIYKISSLSFRPSKAADKSFDKFVGYFNELNGVDGERPYDDHFLAEEYEALPSMTREQSREYYERYTIFRLLTKNTAPDPRCPSCYFILMFCEGDTRSRVEEIAQNFGFEVFWDTTEWTWAEDEELCGSDIDRCDPRKDLTDIGWIFIDAWDTEDGDIVRMFARMLPFNTGDVHAPLTREDESRQTAAMEARAEAEIEKWSR
ncbi:hypothetical protein [Gluconobacter oxydans]|uniref:hypothetical protein n=1 Tax=Gluconobacter oxydans TaxID=442 RepID=UPI0039ED3CF6